MHYFVSGSEESGVINGNRNTPKNGVKKEVYDRRGWG